jgi:16S rRNA (adenine1518-N6/adenine1519-N6)-dimethyltransferase
MPPARQTLSFLKHRFREAGVRPDTRHGQNFLVDLNLLDVLVNRAQVEPHDVVLEVGTGTASLTTRLASLAGAVVTVEVDRELAQLAREQLADCDNVTLLCQDALRNKNHLHAKVLEAVEDQLRLVPGARFKLVANLPYNIATPIISNLLALDTTPVSMTITIQRELAERILAAPSTKDYGALSIWVQSLADVELVRVLPPTVFWPRPKVHSAIIHIAHDPRRRARIPDLVFFHRFVRALFLHRRKFLRAQLLSVVKNQLTKADVDEVLDQSALSGQLRAEQLDVETMQGLCEAFRRRLAG